MLKILIDITFIMIRKEIGVKCENIVILPNIFIQYYIIFFTLLVIINIKIYSNNKC